MSNLLFLIPSIMYPFRKLITAALFVACSTVPALADGTFDTDSVAFSDKITVGDYEATVDVGGRYPSGTNTALVNATRTWIRDHITENKYPVGNGAELVEKVGQNVMNQFRSDIADFMCPMEYTAKFRVPYISDKVVTVDAWTYTYQGGAHGESVLGSQSFMAENGKALSTDGIFKKASRRSVVSLVKKALARQYFQSASIREYVFDPAAIGLPACPPVFTEKGIKFQYQPYEIAPYSSGAPECVIPYSQLRSFMTSEACSLIPASAKTAPTQKSAAKSRKRSRR